MVSDKRNNKEQEKSQYENRHLKKSLKANIKLFKEIFNDDETLFVKPFKMQTMDQLDCCIVFIEGMIDVEVVNRNVIQPILKNKIPMGQKPLEILQNHVIASHKIEKIKDLDKLIQGIIIGNTVLLIEGVSDALIITTKGFKFRDIAEPPSEKVIRGPREGFTEAFLTNLSLLRRKLKTPNLKFKYYTLGVQTNTKICISYIEGIANDKIIAEVEKRLEDINIDGILDSGHIEELIKDSPLSPFKTIGSSERPDVVASRLLEGRIAIIVDGSPNVLIMPFLFQEYFQSNEDYYNNYIFSSINRMLRIFGFFITISVAGVYVALTTYHQEIFPTPLLLSISAARQGVPFPTVIEAITLLFIFEVLREASVRMPDAIGQTMSIVGALVLGQAAIDAKLFSAPMVVIVALSGITALIVPRFKGAIIVVRLLLLFASAFLGLYGFVFGIILVLIHLFGMRSFGVPYMLDYNSFEFQDFKDTMIRAPWWYMRLRPKFISAYNTVRQAKYKKGGKTDEKNG